MKKKLKMIVLVAVGVFSLIVLFAENYAYYDTLAETWLVQLAATAQNVLRSFFFDPIVDISTIVEDLKKRCGDAYGTRAALYSIASFAAPFCTAATLWMVIKWLFINAFKAFEGVKGLFREKILVFGYNETVQQLLRNSTNNSSGARPVVHLVGDEKIADAEEMEFLKQGIFYHWLDPHAAGDKEFIELMHSIGSRKIRKIFVMEGTASQNVSRYMHLYEKDWEARREKKPLFAPGAVCHCLCEESSSRALAIVYHDSKLERRKALNLGGEDTLGLFLFDLTDIRMRKAFDAHPLVEQIDLSRSNPYDVHMLIVGFGHTGEQALRQCVNRSVLCSESSILIDIVDQDAKRKKELFAGTFAHGMVSVGEDYISIGGEQADGELLLRFHDIDIHNEQFSRFLKENAAGMPYTYAAICLQNADQAVCCLNAIQRYARGSKAFPVAVKVKDNHYVACMLDEDEESYPKAFSVVGDDVLTLEDIHGEYQSNRLRAFHEMYNKLDMRSAEERKKNGDKAWTVTPWEKSKYFVKWANDLLDQHTKSRMTVLEALCEGDVAADLRRRIENAGLYMLPTGILAYDYSERELLDKLEADSVLSHMMRMEHRRWCYAMLFAGWSSDCEQEQDEATKRMKKKKNANRMENPCIVNWKILCEDTDDLMPKAKYDLLPLLALCCGGNGAE